ncbi:tRNA pseudouridine(38/39) synthase [Sarcoptes scabiei]|uniref:tRNA pseudouridine(38/39) synthase n=1 Tax=Sarcoptes scabiei TaxID=52283 RepID=A0A834RD55_SARSC|nr:tRNA pseudouridine(38/39) synthase [Sarcoptes scabiei]
MSLENNLINEIDLRNLSKKQLIEEIYLMQNEIARLKNLLKSNHESIETKEESKKRKLFDHSKYRQRHIALKFLYLGWNYDGLVVQENTNNTVEDYIFDALQKTQLIQNRQTCNYNRCGRTDKGVSAFNQVISLTVRSKQLLIDIQDHNHQDGKFLDASEELDYVSILNNVLPQPIRIIGWAPVKSEFNARFDCMTRTYRYYFPDANLDLNAMHEACKYLEGEHDFRNLCKIDPKKVIINFKRKVLNASIQKTSLVNSDICYFQIEATAFLWHQIRFIMAVLFLIGRRLEKPEIMGHLLDIEKQPRRPQFSMASGLPLVLFDTKFPSDIIAQWYTSDNIEKISSSLYGEWVEMATRSAMIEAMLESLRSFPKSIQPLNLHQTTVKRIFGNQSRNYCSLLNRPVCAPINENSNKQ